MENQCWNNTTEKTTKFGVLCGSPVYISHCNSKLPSTYTAPGKESLLCDLITVVSFFFFCHPVCLNTWYLDTARSYAGFLLFLASPSRNVSLFLSFTLNCTTLEICLYSKNTLISSQSKQTSIIQVFRKCKCAVCWWNSQKRTFQNQSCTSTEEHTLYFPTLCVILKGWKN